MTIFGLSPTGLENGHGQKTAIPAYAPGWPEVREERTRWCVPLAFSTEGETGKKTARR
jgi:hypothetical protein